MPPVARSSSESGQAPQQTGSAKGCAGSDTWCACVCMSKLGLKVSAYPKVSCTELLGVCDDHTLPFNSL